MKNLLFSSRENCFVCIDLLFFKNQGKEDLFICPHVSSESNQLFTHKICALSKFFRSEKGLRMGYLGILRVSCKLKLFKCYGEGFGEVFLWETVILDLCRFNKTRFSWDTSDSFDLQP